MIRVFIVEDSATIRRNLQKVFLDAGDFLVVGMAATADAAVAAIPGVNADLVTLDVFLPGGSAVDVVRRVASATKIPIVLLSDAPRDSVEVFEALGAGALDFLRKPRGGDDRGNQTLLNALRALSHVRPTPAPAPAPQPPSLPKQLGIVAIASSTGGPSALRELFGQLPGTFPVPVVIAQHLAEGFEEGLVRWLSQVSPLKFCVVSQSASLQPGTVYLGKSGFDLVVRSTDEVHLTRAPVRGYHPSGDVLFESVSKVFGAQAIGLVLSGIGSDGAAGAKILADAGGIVFSQSADTSVVYGMPKAVAENGSATYIGSPRELGQAVLRTLATSRDSKRRP